MAAVVLVVRGNSPLFRVIRYSARPAPARPQLLTSIDAALDATPAPLAAKFEVAKQAGETVTVHLEERL